MVVSRCTAVQIKNTVSPKSQFREKSKKLFAIKFFLKEKFLADLVQVFRDSCITKLITS